MNIIVLPIIFAVLVFSMLGIYSMTTSSEQTVARDSRESIEELADRKGEVLDARIKDNTILIDSHVQQESKIFLIDFVLKNGTVSRVLYSEDGHEFDPTTPRKENREHGTDAPEIGSGQVGRVVNLVDFKIERDDLASASFLTENGNRFSIDIPQVALLGADGGDGVGGGDGTYGTGTDVNGDGVTNRQDDINGDGTIDDQDVALHMINSMGLQTRIIQLDPMEDTSVLHGDFMDAHLESYQGRSETEVSVIPYIPVTSDTDFATLIVKDNEQHYMIPEFFGVEYTIEHGKLVPIGEGGTNILGYTQTPKILESGIEISQNAQGITLSGEGEMIVKLHNLPEQAMLIKGDISGGTLQIITTELDLIDEEYHSGKGYLTHSQDDDPGHASFSVVGGIASDKNGLLDLYAHTTSRHIHADGNYRACYSGNSNYGQAVVSAYHYPAKTTTFSYTPERRGCNYVTQVEINTPLVKTNEGDHYLITGNSYIAPVLRYTDHGRSYEMSVRSFNLYDTLPGIQLMTASNEQFKELVTFPTEPAYLHVKLNAGGYVTIRGEAYDGETDIFLYVNNVGEFTPYKITKNEYPIAVGMSNHDGQIIVDDFEIDENSPSLLGGHLYLYPDASKYYKIPPTEVAGDAPNTFLTQDEIRDRVENGRMDIDDSLWVNNAESFGKVVFDTLNHETIPIETDENLMYVAHAYAVIHVTGDVKISKLSLDEDVPTPYLDGEYSGRDRIYVPVIPGYETMHLEINGIPATMEFAAILGGTGITIADPASSSIKRVSLTSPIHYASAIAGTSAFAIATSDGNLKAVVSETISGEIEIENTYKLRMIPPPPPEPPNNDPLSGVVDIHINGVKYGQTIVLGVNPNPAFTPTNTGELTVIRGVHYSYPDYVLTGTVTVPVQTGDFVEFFVYAHIDGEIDEYDTPSGHILLSSSGTSSATVNIRSAHITTDM